MTTTISLIRHGEVHNPQQIYYGRLPRFRLSETGREQAAKQANTLPQAGITAVFSSPLLRARQTATIIAKQLQTPLHISKLLLEAHTPHDGKPASELITKNWDLYTGSPPQFEQPVDIKNRLLRLITRLRKQRAGQHVALVTPADCLVWITLWAAQFPLTPQSKLDNLIKAGISNGFPTHASRVTLQFGEDLGEKRPFSLTYHPVVDA